MSDRNRTFLRLRSAVFAVLAVTLAWQVLSRSLVVYLAEMAPEAALSLRASDPGALVLISERKLNLQRPAKDEAGNAGPATSEVGSSRIPSFARYPRKAAQNGPEAADASPDDAAEREDAAERLPSNATDPELREEIRVLAQTALSHDPLNARALRILGQIADAANDDEGARKLMQAAANRSLRESVAVFWLMRESFERGDHAAAIRYADILLRTRPQVIPQVMPTLARIAEDKSANTELKKVLAGNPPWRGLFFSALLKEITDARTPLDLLLSLKDTPKPPTSADLRDYLHVLMQNKFHELAYYVWLQFLPREQLANTGLLFNGSFEVKPSGLPFDWTILQGSGVTIDFARRPDAPGERALLVEFGLGRVQFRGVSQLVLLAPGNYRLKGRHRGKIVGRRGLEWRVLCVGAPSSAAPLAKSAMFTGTTPDWTEFDVNFTVPAAGCRTQQVLLWLDARSASEQLVTGSVWYDDLQIARAE